MGAQWPLAGHCGVAGERSLTGMLVGPTPRPRRNVSPRAESVFGGRIGAYGVAILTALAGLALTALAVKPLAGPFLIPQFAAVVGAGLYGGFGPGLLTMVLSCAGFYAMFLPPAPEGYEAHRLASFAILSVCFVWLTARMRRAKGEAETSQAKAEASQYRAEAARAEASETEAKLIDAQQEGLVAVAEASQAKAEAAQAKAEASQARAEAAETEAKLLGAQQERLMTVAEAAQARAEAAETEARLIGVQQERLVTVVSHDLRSPLNAITVSAQHLQLDASEGQAKVLSRIVNSARRMESMIHDLLDFARVRHGIGIPVQLQPARLGEICRSALEEVRTALPNRAILLDVTGDDSATLDPARVEQVVSNLVTNALKHGAAGAPVRVNVTEDGAGVRLEVTNQGAPIPQHLAPTLFDPFRPGDAAGSFGLGLFIVSEVARAHGGTVSVRSGEERTSFTVAFPRRATDIAVAATACAPCCAQSATTSL
jgi:signal transduction histidine kinase